MDAPKTLLELIEHEEEILLRFVTRFEPLQALETELNKRIGPHKFNIANTVLWDAMLAERDLLVIHFASWVKGLGAASGLFGQIRAHHFPELRKAFTAARKEQPSIPGRARREERFAVRFPEAVPRKRLDPEDLDVMKDAVLKELEPVVDDRNVHRAHPFEHQAQGNVALLDFKQVEDLLKCAQQLMNDLRLFAEKSTLVYSGTSLTNAAQAAEDIVDLLLFTSTIHFATIIGANDPDNPRKQYWWQLRDAFLVELSRVHADTPDLAINDDDVIDRARKNLGTEYKPRPHRDRSLRARIRAAFSALCDR